MATVDVEPHELSARWAELLALAQAGTEIIVTENGAPAARLIPLVEGERASPAYIQGPLKWRTILTAPLPDDFWTGKA